MTSFVHEESHICDLDLDGCVSQMSTSAGGVSVVWPETDLGQTVTVLCPCANFSLGIGHPAATRTCTGSFTTGAQWQLSSLDICDFSSTTQNLCQVSLVRFSMSPTLDGVVHHFLALLL